MQTLFLNINFYSSFDIIEKLKSASLEELRTLDSDLLSQYLAYSNIHKLNLNKNKK